MEWVDIRRKARECHQVAFSASNGARDAKSLVSAALKRENLQLTRFAPGTSFGPGVLGMLERAERIVHVINNLVPPVEAAVVAHELGHFHLHLDPRNEVTVHQAGLAGDRIASGVGKVEGYSPRERKEVQADVFAGEFLCPSDWLRSEYVTHRKVPSVIAAELGVSPELVLNQLIRALLLPPLRSVSARSAQTRPTLDDAQRTAAHWTGGPVLVDAGPGTGKTRTLIERVSFLLGKGVAPTAILALTFSNRAAEDMRERLAAAHGDAAIEVWVGTFHAFGLELVTKWPNGIGRSPKVRVLDDSDALALLEKYLASLPLRHYQNLYEPAYELVHVLRAISRCKDEMITPEEYLKHAQTWLKTAANDEEREKAEKAVEIAEVFAIYEVKLRDHDSVDFGDLIRHAIALIEGHPDVRGYIGGFQHVLVDEYQDVNLASARMLRAIHNLGAAVWVVADQRQSIYRFRGAEPSNVARFPTEFKGQIHPLGTNYRSFAPVVGVFQKFSGAMAGGGMAGRWTALRGNGGSATLTSTANLQAEAVAIRDKVENLRTRGLAYRDQIILGRTHLTLARITSALEDLGVPLLYLGDLFERAEIRDLLSLLSLDAEPGGHGLLRIATLPFYKATRNDVRLMIEWAREHQRSVIESLSSAHEVDGVSIEGAKGLRKLGSELEGLRFASGWRFLTAWLFERSEYLGPLLTAGDARSIQQLIAIYHLLKVCGEQSLDNGSRGTLLARIRRLEALNQDVGFRAVASEATDSDAVRVMTVHASKGLEFPAVHVPALATSYFPTKRHAVHNAPPPTLARLAMDSSAHDAEEECLFFVAVSRARDHLSLSRADKYTASRNASPSKFLEHIAGTVTLSKDSRRPAPVSLPVISLPQSVRQRYSEQELDLYIRCPARYRYEMLDGLRSGRSGSPYVDFHRCVYSTIGWLEAEKTAGRATPPASALAWLKQEWEKRGPISHGFEPYYRRAAEDMVARMAGLITSQPSSSTRESWLVPLNNRQIELTPDRVLASSRQPVVVQRIRTGKQTKSETDKPIYALLRAGASNQYPGQAVQVETLYLSTGDRVPIDGRNDAKKLQAYEDAIAGIEQGLFGSEPDDARKCPTCPNYFICKT